MGKEEKSRNKAPPPPAPKTKAPPTNAIDSQKKTPTKPPQISHEDEISCRSGEEAEHANIIAGAIDLSKPEQVAGPRNLMKLAIDGFKAGIVRYIY